MLTGLHILICVVATSLTLMLTVYPVCSARHYYMHFLYSHAWLLFGGGILLGRVCCQLRGGTLITFGALQSASTAAADSCLPYLEISPGSRKHGVIDSNLVFSIHKSAVMFMINFLTLCCLSEDTLLSLKLVSALR